MFSPYEREILMPKEFYSLCPRCGGIMVVSKVVFLTRGIKKMVNCTRCGFEREEKIYFER